MSEAATPFGNISIPESVSKKRQLAVLRALNWCDDIAKESAVWTREEAFHGLRLTRAVNGHELAVYPITAAKLDTGIFVGMRFAPGHLPVEVNGAPVCVTPHKSRTGELHTDMVACFLLLCGGENVPLTHLPHTLKTALYPERFNPQGRPIINHQQLRRRRELQEAFLPQVSRVDDAVAHVNALDPQDWVLLRDGFRWPFHREVAVAIAQGIVEDHLDRDEADVLWALVQFGEQQDGDFMARIRHMLRSSPHVAVHRFALTNYREDDPETAWAELHPFLNSPHNDVVWLAHTRLSALCYAVLEERLVERCDGLLEEEPDRWLERQLVIWLSHRQNMDVWIQRIVAELPQHDLGQFLQRIRTYGSWFERWAKERLSSPLESVQIGIVEASKRNMTVNHGRLWLPLMKRGSGEVNRTILSAMRDIDDEDAYMLVDEVWHSPWRFVLRTAYMLVPHNFPHYPGMRAMFEAGLKSSHERIRRDAQKHLDRMDQTDRLTSEPSSA